MYVCMYVCTLEKKNENSEGCYSCQFAVFLASFQISVYYGVFSIFLASNIACTEFPTVFNPDVSYPNTCNHFEKSGWNTVGNSVQAITACYAIKLAWTESSVWNGFYQRIPVVESLKLCKVFTGEDLMLKISSFERELFSLHMYEKS